ncbi:MAG TPA: hypothetical protein VNE58_06725 [Casimicrobiaceae bacterium]|nr:hypothetical protein [Casimicrobiaceae bacterium]
MSGFARWAVMAVLAAVAIAPARANVVDLDWNAACVDPALPLPRFITHHYIALDKVERVSKFRSGYGLSCDRKVRSKTTRSISCPTAGRGLRDQMVALGCIAEGYGLDAVIVCAAL